MSISDDPPTHLAHSPIRSRHLLWVTTMLTSNRDCVCLYVLYVNGLITCTFVSGSFCPMSTFMRVIPVLVYGCN